MDSPLMSAGLSTLSGLKYGSALAVTSALAAGFGHGTYTPVNVSSAPFGGLGFTVALAGTVFLWTAVGLGLDWLQGRARRYVISVVLIGHYCSAVWLLSSPDNDLSYLVRGPLSLWIMFGLWGLLYVYVQVVAWRSLRSVVP
jgi:hypothetical protein